MFAARDHEVVPEVLDLEEGDRGQKRPGDRDGVQGRRARVIEQPQDVQALDQGIFHRQVAALPDLGRRSDHRDREAGGLEGLFGPDDLAGVLENKKTPVRLGGGGRPGVFFPEKPKKRHGYLLLMVMVYSPRFSTTPSRDQPLAVAARETFSLEASVSTRTSMVPFPMVAILFRVSRTGWGHDRPRASTISLMMVSPYALARMVRPKYRHTASPTNTAAMPWGPTPSGELARPKLWEKAAPHDHSEYEHGRAPSPSPARKS
jgi:hypothetical protein